MMKLLSLAAVAGVAAAADEAPIGRTTQSRSLEGVTTAELEAATRTFIASNNLGARRRPRGDRGGKKKKQKQKKRRGLRFGSNREWRSSKGGKDDDDDWWGGGYESHDEWSGGGGWCKDDWWGGGGMHRRLDNHDMGGNGRKWGGGGGRDDWWGSGSSKGRKGGGGGWRGGGKGGKWASGSGKSGKWGGGGGGGGWGGGGHEEVFYLLPTACPNHCVSSDVGADDEMTDVLQPCHDHADDQMWRVISDGSYVMIESYDHPGMCIAVDYEHGDDEVMLAQTCYNGELFLKDCCSEYGTQWYFTGGQLVNGMCWAAGLSSMMTVFLEERNNVDMQECMTDLAVWGANDEAVLKADTFLFVNHLPEAPFTNVVEDVIELLKEKLPKNNKDGLDLVESNLVASLEEGDT